MHYVIIKSQKKQCGRPIYQTMYWSVGKKEQLKGVVLVLKQMTFEASSNSNTISIPGIEAGAHFRF